MKLRFISSALAAALFAATGSYAAVVDGGRDADLVVMVDCQIPSDDLIVHFF
ncbi:hypothetical protein [Escherichia coli]|uniref:hypothetical protein n=1 Tax=Escherichia coli TaxID=562 RepID=UPI002409403E|nr:hypothetical protein [Escherichia coli]